MAKFVLFFLIATYLGCIICVGFMAFYMKDMSNTLDEINESVTYFQYIAGEQ